MLFSNPEVARLMNFYFVCGWENVHAVPVVEIDFGNGHKLKRTVNGNIATYICSPDGIVLDVITGLNDVPTYTRRLREALELYEYALASSDPVAFVRDFHVAGGKVPAESSRRLQSFRERRDLDSKFAIEGPLKKMLLPAAESPPDVAIIGDDTEIMEPVGKSLVELRIKDAIVPITGAANIRVEHPLRGPVVFAPALTKSGNERVIEDELVIPVATRSAVPATHDLIEASRDTLTLDSWNNEGPRRALVHAMLAERPGVTPADLTTDIYRDVMHTDLDDPYLGLAPMLLGGEIGRSETAIDE